MFAYRLKNDQYQYKNVESRSGSGGETSLTDLKKFTKYSIVVQAYNALGPGPTSNEVLALTLEDVPSASPQDVRCTTFTSQSLQVSWNSVPDTQLHGHLKGTLGLALIYFVILLHWRSLFRVQSFLGKFGRFRCNGQTGCQNHNSSECRHSRSRKIYQLQRSSSGLHKCRRRVAKFSDSLPNQRRW